MAIVAMRWQAVAVISAGAAPDLEAHAAPGAWLRPGSARRRPARSGAPLTYLPHLLEQTNPRRHPHIKRLHPPRHRNLHPLGRQRGDGGGQTLPFRAEQPGHRAAQVEGVEVDGVAQVGGEDVAFEALQRFTGGDVFKDAQAEVGAHRCA